MSDEYRIVRLESCTLRRFKNVMQGTVELLGRCRGRIPDKYKAPDMRYDRGKCRDSATLGTVVGLYGQNGTGKTAVVDALSLVKLLLCGVGLPDEFGHYIMLGQESAEVECRFYWRGRDGEGLVDYRAEAGMLNEKPVLLREEITFTSFGPAGRKCKPVIVLCFGRGDDNAAGLVFPRDFYATVSPERRDAMLRALAVAESKAASCVFTAPAFELFHAQLPPVHAAILEDLRWYACDRMQIINRQYCGLVTLGAMPFSLGYFGIATIPVAGPVSMRVLHVRMLEDTVSRLNPVLGTIIPGLSMTVKRLGAVTGDDGSEEERVELLAVRGGRELPLRLESEGIRKIVSILGALEIMYNNQSYLLIVDELDAGIYEYLLGRMLQVFERSGKGQLVFTSHNLRPLETLSAASIVFTTTNPCNRFVRYKGKNPTHNLRDCYIRTIHSGGQDEVLYEDGGLDKMGIAFCLAAPGENNHGEV